MPEFCGKPVAGDTCKRIPGHGGDCIPGIPFWDIGEVTPPTITDFSAELPFRKFMWAGILMLILTLFQIYIDTYVFTQDIIRW
ncbi:MAG TPA: hypothetical protein VGR89_00470 [Puia sp.]|nr:hypothetical protein [Puia sp.]